MAVVPVILSIGSKFGPGGLASLQAGIQMLGRMGTAIKNVIIDSSDFAEQLNRLGNRDITEASKAVKGFISDLEIMRASNTIAMTGLNLTQKEFRSVIVAAAEFTEVIGGDVTSNLKNLTRALMTGRTESLRPFGLELSKTSDIGERQREVIAQLTARYGDLNFKLHTAADKIQAASNKLKNFSEAVMVQFVANAEGGVTALDGLTAAMGLLTGTTSKAHIGFTRLDSILWQVKKSWLEVKQSFGFSSVKEWEQLLAEYEAGQRMQYDLPTDRQSTTTPPGGTTKPPTPPKKTKSGGIAASWWTSREYISSAAAQETVVEQYLRPTEEQRPLGQFGMGGTPEDIALMGGPVNTEAALWEEQIEHEKELHEIQQERYRDLLEAQNQYQFSERDYIEESTRMWQTSLEAKGQMLSNFFGGFAVLMQSESKKAWKIGKGFAIAQAVIHTALAATKAYQSMAGIPIAGPILAPLAAAAAVASGAIQIRKIKETKFQGGAQSAPTAGMSAGGPIGGGGQQYAPPPPVAGGATQQAPQTHIVILRGGAEKLFEVVEEEDEKRYNSGQTTLGNRNIAA